MKNLKFQLISVLCCFMFMVEVANANIIDDTYGVGAGSFEIGTFVDPGYHYMVLPVGLTAISGWTVGGLGGVDWLLAPYFGTNSGLYAIDLIEATAGSISTVIPTMAGQIYDLSFYASTVSTGNALGVVSAGSLVDQAFSAPITSIQNIASLNYSLFSFLFTAIGTDTTVNFMATPIGSSCLPDCAGPIIDSVSVSLVAPSAVPEPSQILLFGAGLAGLLGTRLRSKNLFVQRCNT